MIRDQRSMSGPRLLETVEDVEAFWAKRGMKYGWVGEHGLRVPGQLPILRTETTLVPYVDSGRWVADCPACSGGIACWVENPRGCCLDCGGLYAISFPPGQVIADAEAVLLSRPEATNRNFFPERETVADLKSENAIRGLPFS